MQIQSRVQRHRSSASTCSCPFMEPIQYAVLPFVPPWSATEAFNFEKERWLRQRTATIRREQTEKSTTDLFEKSNYPSVLGFKHLVDMRGSQVRSLSRRPSSLRKPRVSGTT